MANPLVTIIIPIYNSASFIRDCLDSIVHQTYCSIEIILIDDASTDDSLAVVSDYADKDERIIVLKQSHNSGAAECRNLALDNMHGDYLTFVDSDDVVSFDYIDILLSGCISQNTAICVGRFVRKYSSDVFYRKEAGSVYLAVQLDEFLPVYYDINSDYRILYVAIWNKLFRKDAWGTLRFPNIRFSEDGYVLSTFYKNIGKIVICDSVTYFYRSRAGSVTASYYKHELENHLYVLNYQRQLFKDSAYWTMAENCIQKYKVNLCLNFFYYEHSILARNEIIKDLPMVAKVMFFQKEGFKFCKLLVKLVLHRF